MNGLLFAVASLAAASVLIFWARQTAAHDARLRRIPIRVHVNGVRGKSTVVRYIAAALREHGIETLAKTTGNETRIIHADARETPVARRGAPTIIEQIDVLRAAVRPTTQAIVFECMALRPEYQRVSERRMIRSTDGVIANVRLDHVEELGETRADVARSLSATAPAQAPLFTAETHAESRAVLDVAARSRGGRLVTVSGADLTRRERAGLGPLTFPENVALAVAIAGRHGVPRAVALDGIRKARSDPGAARIHRHRVDGRTLYWINLFGVNDVPSAEMNVRLVSEWLGSAGRIVFLFNNRADRQNRAVQFADMVAHGRAASKVLLIGETLSVVARRIAAQAPTLDVARLDGRSELSAASLARRAAGDGGAKNGTIVLVGLANIHTRDAERVIAALETPATEWTPAAATPREAA